MSDDTPATNLYQALLQAQRMMGPVKKDASNPAFRTKYATLQSVLETIDGPLNDNGLVLLQRFDVGEGVPVLITEIVHAASGDRIASAVPVMSKDPTDPQKMGGAITYYRRYSLLALLGLAPEDDDGHAASQPRPQPVPARSQAARPAPPAGKPANYMMLDEVEAEIAPLEKQIRRNDDAVSNGDYARYHALDARRKELRATPAPPAALPPAASAHIEKDLLDAIRNDLAGPDERWNALWDYYDRATDVADLNRRAEVVKASGVPERDLRAAYKQRHSALAQLLAPVERPASYGG